MLTSFLPGFALSMTLILAIGAQNAFVLRQGLRREHVFWCCFICAICDVILIVAGVAGFGALAEAAPWFEPLMRYGGAAFLIWYGIGNARAALKGGNVLEVGGASVGDLRRTVLTLLAITVLNPHVYLDTVVLLGSISAQYDDKVAFAAGASTASTLYFFALGYGARLLTPLFAKPVSWRILDALIALTMWGIAAKLLLM